MAKRGGGRHLSVEERQKLERLCIHFDITYQESRPGRVRLEVLEHASTRTSDIAADSLHCRLLSEICERLVPWVYFHPKEHCADTLFRHDDARLMRLSDLYRAARATGKSAAIFG